MPTLPLFSTPSDPNAWHAVRSPGGFEWWRFDAEDDAGRRVAVDFFDGDPFDARSAAAYRRYRRGPTRHAPPVPHDYPRFRMTIDAPAGTRTEYSTAQPIETSSDTLRLKIADATGIADGSGALLLRAGSAMTAVDLAFSPIAADPFRAELHPDLQWILAAPRCTVSGTITIAGRATPFLGRGYQDHFVGLHPISQMMAGWFFGRVLLANGAIFFHECTLAGENRASIRIVRASADGVAEESLKSASMKLQPALPWRAAYPLAATFSNGLSLDSPRIVRSSASVVELAYASTYQGQRGVAHAVAIRPRSA
jgi:hypothetical protein